MDIKAYIKSKWIPIAGNMKTPKPLYDYYKELNSTQPCVYNEYGELYKFYFIRDIHMAAEPYTNLGRYFIWDRYNWGFKTHFYTHNAMLQTLGKPNTKYGMLIESRAITPNDYKIFKKHKGLEREFEQIYTFDDEILNDISNAVFYPASADFWYAKEKPELLTENSYKNKTKNISFLSSNKVMCEMHKKRIAAAKYCHNNHLADVYGKVVSNNYVEIETPLQNYRFSFAVENEQTDYYFTEKITNCFAAQTIPIYFGARKINEFFNEDGIIRITEKDFENIEHIIKQCTKEEYEQRLPAVLDNYQRVQEYRHRQDYLYEHYLQENEENSL